jgi:poly(A) polymerase
MTGLPAYHLAKIVFSNNQYSGGKYLGVTPPISLSGPSERDEEMTAELEEALRASGLFESDEDGVRRELVLGKLNTLVREFVREVARRKHLPETLIGEVSGKIYTFGSYRLGVHSTGADIDTLCVAPQHVERSDFFNLFYSTLETHPEVTELTQVPDAYVPVIKMKFAGISIDLIFAKLGLTTIPEDLDLLDSNILRNLDEKCILSLNGVRVTDELLKLVPNVLTFHLALRCIKLWAKRRGIYNNAMGYVAGVALALLTARICQLYPNATASTVVTRLFKIYQQWPWPQPVYLKPIEDLPFQMKVWNPRIHVADRYHKMPVITPAYPSMCSTHNVTASTIRIMTEEFRRGADIMIKIEQRRAVWSDLFAKTDFFARHRNFFQVLAVSESEEAHRIWSGFLGSKMRHLTPKLELEELIEAAPPFHEGFELIVEGDSLEDVRTAHFFNDDAQSLKDGEGGGKVEGEKAESPTSTLSTSPATSATMVVSKKKYYTMAFYVALIIAPPDPSKKGPRRLCLDQPINDFKNFVSAYDKLAPTMHILIRDIKRENLPSYVFQGEPRPPRIRRRPRMEPEGDIGSPKRTKMGDREISVESVASINGLSVSTASLPIVEPDAS